MGKMKPAIPKVYKPTLQLVDESEEWVKEKVTQNVVPAEITEQVKEDTKKVRPDLRAYHPIHSDTKRAWQANLMFIYYPNSAQETRLHAFL